MGEETMNRKGARKPKPLSFAEDLIENLPIGMMILDKHGRIIRMNKKQEETSQIEREKILGKSFSEAFPRTLEQGVKEPYFKLLKYGIPFDVIIDRYIPQYYSKQMTYHARGAPVLIKRKIDFLLKEAQLIVKDWENTHTKREVVCIRRNQSTFPASLLITDIKDTTGKSTATLYLLADLTEKKEMEERLFLSEKLALYTGPLKKKNSEIKRFLGIPENKEIVGIIPIGIPVYMPECPPKADVKTKVRWFGS